MTEPGDFRAVLRNLASGVPVVTTVWETTNYGTTATAFTSVSLEPLLVQVTLDRESNTREMIDRSGMFAVSILAAGQERIARDFATKGIDRFENCEIKVGANGMPLVAGAIGHLECRVAEKFPGGDHTIVVGEVLDGAAYDGPPLIYFQGNYRRLAGFDEEEKS